MSSTLNREHPKTAIPQLSKDINWFKENNVKINRVVIELSDGKAKDISEYAQYFQTLTMGYFTAIAGDVEFLTSRNAYIEKLKADVADFDFIVADEADIAELKVGNFIIGGLEVNVFTLIQLAQLTANSKAKVIQTAGEGVPSPPYSVGDIWLLKYTDTDDKLVHEIYTCKTAKSEGESFDQSDWEFSATDDHTAREALDIATTVSKSTEEIRLEIASLTDYDEFNATRNNINDRIAELNWGGYLSMYGLMDGEPVVVVGNDILSAYVMMVTDESLGFYKNNGTSHGIESTPTAYFGRSSTQNLFGLISDVVEAQKYTVMGDFVWIANADGGLTLKKVGT